jgi:hypothetical protein
VSRREGAGEARNNTATGVDCAAPPENEGSGGRRRCLCQGRGGIVFPFPRPGKCLVPSFFTLTVWRAGEKDGTARGRRRRHAAGSGGRTNVHHTSERAHSHRRTETSLSARPPGFGPTETKTKNLLQHRHTPTQEWWKHTLMRVFGRVNCRTGALTHSALKSLMARPHHVG